MLGYYQKKSDVQKMDNLSFLERDAIKRLQEAQSQGLITIKKVNKGGGVCILNTDDYISEMHSQLKAVFKNPDGTTTQFYVPVREDSLIQQKTKLINLIKTGVEQNIVSVSDAKVMELNAKPGRLYGVPKLLKDITQGKRLPPCRPIVSQSGASTEHCSAFVDMHSKHLVKN